MQDNQKTQKSTEIALFPQEAKVNGKTERDSKPEKSVYW